VVQDRGQWWTLVKTVMNLRVLGYVTVSCPEDKNLNNHRYHDLKTEPILAYFPYIENMKDHLAVCLCIHPNLYET
jgi:hypothetical protein